MVLSLKPTCYFQIAIGKAHLITLSKNGDIFTFGMNNKGQCGRDFSAVGKESQSSAAAAAAAAANNAFNNAAAAAASSSGGASGVISNDLGLEDVNSDQDIDGDSKGRIHCQ